MITAIAILVLLLAVASYAAYSFRRSLNRASKNLKEWQANYARLSEAYEDAKQKHEAVRTDSPRDNFNISVSELSKLPKGRDADTVLPGVP